MLYNFLSNLLSVLLLCHLTLQADEVCEHLLVRINNLTKYPCYFIGEDHQKSNFVNYTYPAGVILPNQSMLYVVDSVLHKLFHKRTYSLITYRCHDKKITLESILHRCGHLPEGRVLDGSDHFKINYEPVKSFDQASYGIISWYISEEDSPTKNSEEAHATNDMVETSTTQNS
ncbi:MAG: hypothetical protein VXY77_03690 [Pseudomonadota bacterium]|nr:hypothetical protein [Pseudomonadota bacterium]